jgi:branched-chain amino acid transport system permease protein
MSLHQSGYVVMMTLVGGGLVSFWGPVVGVFLFLIARDVIGALTNAWMLYFGLLFMAIVLFRPEGVAGAAAAALQRHSLGSIRRQGSSAMRLLFGGERWR